MRRLHAARVIAKFPKARELFASKRTATATMQKEIRERDKHCCSYVYKDGSRCKSTRLRPLS